MARETPGRRSAPRRSSPGRHSAAPPNPPPADNPSDSSPAQRSEQRTAFPIVGIGASAGGLEAFSELLKALPADTGMAFVLVQHLDPNHESQLAEVLSRTTPMPVIGITDGLRVAPDHAYVIPSNADIAIADGVFALTPRAGVDRHRPIDHFFRSLARDQEGRAIGVVLSGTGSDGTLGLRAIKAEGGITFVQDAKSAKQPGMPQSAAAVADFVLPPAAIARELARIGNHLYVSHAVPPPPAPTRLSRTTGVGSAPFSEPCASPPASISRSTSLPPSGAGSPAACCCSGSTISGHMPGS